MESFNIYIKESQRQLINSATENLQLQQSEGDKECPKVGIKAKETLKPAVKPTLRPAAKLDVSNPMEAYYFQSANRDISSKKLPGQLSSKYTPQIESRNLSQSQSSDKYAISMESCNRSSSENKMGYQSPVLASGFLPRYAGKPKEQLSEDLEEESIRR